MYFAQNDKHSRLIMPGSALRFVLVGRPHPRPIGTQKDILNKMRTTRASARVNLNIRVHHNQSFSASANHDQRFLLLRRRSKPSRTASRHLAPLSLSLELSFHVFSSAVATDLRFLPEMAAYPRSCCKLALCSNFNLRAHRTHAAKVKSC